MSTVELIAKRYIQRTDVKAVQNRSAWTPDRTKFTRADLEDHVAGRSSLGHYLVGTDGQCKLFAFDIDLNKQGWYDGQHTLPREVWRAGSDTPLYQQLRDELLITAEALALRTRDLLDIDVAVAYSGSKGFHVYGYTGPNPASDVREAAIEVLDSFRTLEPVRGNAFWAHRMGLKNVTIEVFPKQVNLDGKDLGNLMRLPLGTHLKGTESHFIKFDSEGGYQQADPDLAMEKGDPWADL